MRSKLAALLLVIGLAAPALADHTGIDCRPIPGTGSLWTAVTEAWLGCNPGTVNTNFGLDADDRVVIEGDITIQDGVGTPGSVDVQDGIMTIAAGRTLTFGEHLVIDGGKFVGQGSVIDECTIKNAIDWTTATSGTHTVVVDVDCDTSDMADGTDWVVPNWEDPPGGVGTPLNGAAVQFGPGPKGSDSFRPGYSSGRWYDITAVAAGQLTIDLNRDSGNYTGTPYRGTRHVATAADPINLTDAAEVTSCTTDFYGMTSEIVFEAAFNVAGTDQDFSDMYLQFNEENDTTANHDSCSGMAAKVLASEDTTNDRLLVAGNVCGCTGSAHITPGLRRGDVIKVVRPAVLSGDSDGDGVGDAGIECLSGELELDWVLIDRLGDTDKDAPEACDGTGSCSPNRIETGYERDQGLSLVVSGTAGDPKQCDVSITNTAIIGGSPNGSDDKSVIGLNGSSTPDGAGFFLPNDGLLDGSRIKLDKLYLGQTLTNDTGGPTFGGEHGIYLNGAENVVVTRARIQHTNDDLIGGHFEPSTGTSTDIQSFKCVGCLLYGALPGSANSSQGIEFDVETTASVPGNIQYEIPTGWQTIVDTLVMGTLNAPLRTIAQNTRFSRVVVGGSDQNPGHVLLRMDNTGAADDEDADDMQIKKNPVHFRDGLIVASSAPAATANIDIGGHVYNSIFLGGFQPTSNSILNNMVRVEGAVIDWGNNVSSNSVLHGLWGTSPDATTSDIITLKDSAIKSSGAIGVSERHRDGQTVVTRLAAFLDDGQVDGPLAEVTAVSTGASNVSTINGVFSTVGPTPAINEWDTVCSGSAACTITASNICLESRHNIPSQTFNKTGGTDIRSDSVLQVADMDPDADAGSTTLGSIVGNGDGTVCGDLSRPRRLGWENFGWSHAMLGDFVIRDHRNYGMTQAGGDLIQAVRGGGGRPGPRGF